MTKEQEAARQSLRIAKQSWEKMWQILDREPTQTEVEDYMQEIWELESDMKDLGWKRDNNGEWYL